MFPIQKNINFRQGYGLTETNGGTSVGKRNDTNHSSVGHVFGSCQVKIADIKTQEALGPNQVRITRHTTPKRFKCSEVNRS